jgi:hypothetical protein
LITDQIGGAKMLRHFFNPIYFIGVITMGMDIYGHSGNYFRANIWSWRAIVVVMELSGINVPSSWCCNDGAGCDDETECNIMAGKIDAFLTSWDENRFYAPSANGLAVDKNGQFVPAETEGAVSPYCVDREHLAEFAEFLRTCGGFKIH